MRPPCVAAGVGRTARRDVRVDVLTPCPALSAPAEARLRRVPAFPVHRADIIYRPLRLTARLGFIKGAVEFTRVPISRRRLHKGNSPHNHLSHPPPLSPPPTMFALSSSTSIACAAANHSSLANSIPASGMPISHQSTTSEPPSNFGSPQCCHCGHRGAHAHNCPFNGATQG
jgi:hypothetical protein